MGGFVVGFVVVGYYCCDCVGGCYVVVCFFVIVFGGFVYGCDFFG